jgi:hypothetical protein
LMGDLMLRFERQVVPPFDEPVSLDLSGNPGIEPGADPKPCVPLFMSAEQTLS